MRGAAADHGRHPQRPFAPDQPVLVEDREEAVDGDPVNGPFR
jgi:hypothetical protein